MFLNAAVLEWLCTHLCRLPLCVCVYWERQKMVDVFFWEERRRERRGYYFPALATSVTMPTVYLDFGWVLRGAWKVYSGRQGLGFLYHTGTLTEACKRLVECFFFFKYIAWFKARQISQQIKARLKQVKSCNRCTVPSSHFGFIKQY